MLLSVADPGGRRRRAPPHGSKFFRFDIQIFQNIAASGVGAPYEVGAPYGKFWIRNWLWRFLGSHMV